MSTFGKEVLRIFQDQFFRLVVEDDAEVCLSFRGAWRRVMRVKGVGVNLGCKLADALANPFRQD